MDATPGQLSMCIYRHKCIVQLMYVIGVIINYV